VWITHILGSLDKKTKPCPHASLEAIAEAKTQRSAGQQVKDAKDRTASKHARSPSVTESTDATAPKKSKQSMLRTYTGHDMPFSPSEADAIQSQALRAIVSANAPFSIPEDPEMLTLFGMLRSQAPSIIPTGKVIGGRLLNESYTTVEGKLSKILEGQMLGLLYVPSTIMNCQLTEM
jgi:hypothetical protein